MAAPTRSPPSTPCRSSPSSFASRHVNARTDEHGRIVAASAVTVFAILVIGGVYLPHVRGYFFLFDDFSLLADASRATLRAIVTQPLFGFYRPVAFLFTKAEFALFGGWNPAAFAASALVLHTLN